MSSLLWEPKVVFVFSSFLKVRVTTAPMLIDHSNWTKFWKSSDKSDSLIYIYCNTWKIHCPFEMIQIRSSHLSLIYSYCGRFQITFYPLAIILMLSRVAPPPWSEPESESNWDTGQDWEVKHDSLISSTFRGQQHQGYFQTDADHWSSLILCVFLPGK